MHTRGFTLLEACIACAMFLIVMGVVLAVTSDMANFATRQDTQCAFALNSSQAMTKLDQELRKTGQTVVGGVAYPQVANANTEFNFVRLADPPCTTNGGADLLWNPTVYTVKIVNGELGIWEGNVRKMTLCAGVESVSFAQAGRRITIDMVLARTDARNNRVAHSTRHMMIMRN
jgi:type II secretory pathway pseudopilin PulG